MASSDNDRFTFELWVYLGVRTCELFLCFVAIVRVRVRVIMLTSLFSLFYVTREFHRFLHRGRASGLGTCLMKETVVVWYSNRCPKFIFETLTML